MTGPAARYPLDAVGTVTLDAAGRGTVRLFVPSTRVTWHVTGAAVQVSSNTLEPVCNVYNSTTARLLGGTFTGSQDQIGWADEILRGGSIFATWTGGDVGSVATLSLSGWYETTRA